MKFFHHIKGQILEYCLIILVFVIPPIFSSPLSDAQTESGRFAPLSLPALVFYTIAAAFFYLRAGRAPDFRKKNGFFAIKNLFVPAFGMLLCYCALILSALFWNYAAKVSGNTELPSLIFPQTFDKRLLLYASAIVLASYEEMLFRFFLPECGLAIIHDIAPESEKSKSGFVLKAAAETIPIVLFALAHRYLGLFAVGNALCAAIILRLALYKKLHIALLCAVHAAYNITIFIALSCMRS
ncbi:CPBP family glutamic-type intramembrane protease [Treponema sp. HNW]|uniref:CPBP family glutamic-type intramembrane protease n=1 Tax=Treponema sp. HNW TaxID=3116654 RepID=UPI003D0D8BBF